MVAPSEEQRENRSPDELLRIVQIAMKQDLPGVPPIHRLDGKMEIHINPLTGKHLHLKVEADWDIAEVKLTI
jgi:hypothetical protein